MGQKPTESGPIEEESSVTRQCLEVAILRLNEFRNQLEDKQGHDEPALKEVMATLRDAYTALEVCELDNADNNRAWANNLLPQISTLNCGHAPTRCYTEMWEDGTVDVVAECLKCSYSVGIPLSQFHHDGNYVHAVKINEDDSCSCDCHESNWPSPSGEHGPCWCDCE
tara:strand:- start:66 stop:569 length:504 start_codon:yes stop_codon:yes gene_type:complete